MVAVSVSRRSRVGALHWVLRSGVDLAERFAEVCHLRKPESVCCSWLFSSYSACNNTRVQALRSWNRALGSSFITF